MSLKNKDLENSSSDVIKSQLADAYDEGVAGYGEQGEPAEIYERQYSIEVNDLSDYTVTGETSSKPNKDVINKIASIQIENTEIDQVKDKLDALFIEANIDSTMIDTIITAIESLPDGNELKTRYTNLVNTIQSEINSTTDIIDAAARIRAVTDIYESTLAKGNLFANVKGLVTDTPVLFAVLVAQARSNQNLDPQVIENSDDLMVNSTSTFSEGQKVMTPDFFAKLSRCMGGENSEVFAEKTVSALIAQSLALTQEALDYGVSERFFRRITGISPSPDTVTDPGDSSDPSSVIEKTTVSNPFVSKLAPSARHVAYLEDDLEESPKQLSRLFGISPTAQGVGQPMSDPSLSKGSNHGPVHNLPKFIDGLSSKEKLIYLTSIISREVMLSRGLVAAYQGRSAETNRALKFTDLSNLVAPLSRNTLGASYYPPGERLLGPSALVANVGIPMYSPSLAHAGNLSGLMSVLSRPVPEQESDASRGFLPLEVLDPSDPDNIYHVGHEANETLKTLVTNSLQEDPENAADYLSLHLDYLKDAKEKILDANHVMSHINNVQFQANGVLNPRNPAGRILRKVIEHLADMCIQTETENWAGPTYAVADLVALTTFFVPQSEASEDQKFLKEDYVRRICSIDLMDKVPLQGTQENQNLGFDAPTNHLTPEGKLGYHPLLLSWFADRGLFLLLNPNNSNGAPSYLNYESGYVHFWDNINTLDKYRYAGFNPDTVAPHLKENEVLKDLQNRMYRSSPYENQFITQALKNLTQGSVKVLTDDIDQEGFYALAMQLQAAGEQQTSETGPFVSITGYDYVNAVWGQGGAHIALSAQLKGRILDVVHYIENDMSSPTALSEQTKIAPAIGGCTLANGMDKGQLISYVLEIFSILANEMFTGVFEKSPYSVAINHTHGEQFYASFLATQGNPFFSSAMVIGNDPGIFNHKLRIVPKITGINPADGGASAPIGPASGISSLTMTQYGNYLKEIASDFKTPISLLDPAAFTDYANHKLECAFGPDSNAMKIKLYKGGNYAFGKTMSLRDFHQILEELAEEASFPTIAFTCAADTLGYVATMYDNVGLHIDPESPGLPGKVLAALDDADFSNETFAKFMKEANLNQIAYAGLKKDAIQKSISPVYRSGIDISMRSKGLDRAALLYLNHVLDEGKDFVEFTFFGVNHKVHKDEITKAIAKSLDLTTDKDKALVYEFSFIKNSELDESLTFIRNEEKLPNILFNLGTFTTLEKIRQAMRTGPVDGQPPPSSSFAALINGTSFYRIKFKGTRTFYADIEEVKGSQLADEARTRGNEAAIIKQMENAVSSILMSYLFEKLTGFPIQAQNIASNKEMSISRSALKIFLDGAKIVNTQLEYNSDDVIDALFEEDPDSSSLNEAIKMKTSEEEILKALTPTLSRVGVEPVLLNPVVSEEVFLLVQALMKSVYLTGASINETILSTSEFDAVFGIETSVIEKFNNYNIPGTAGLPSTPQAVKTSAIQYGEMRLNNYKAVVGRKVQSASDVGE